MMASFHSIAFRGYLNQQYKKAVPCRWQPHLIAKEGYVWVEVDRPGWSPSRVQVPLESIDIEVRMRARSFPLKEYLRLRHLFTPYPNVNGSH